MRRENGLSYFYQWELNQRLIVEEDCTMVLFYNGTISKPLGCEVFVQDGVRYVYVPNVLLQTAAQLEATAWDDSTTSVVSETFFSVIPKAKPENYAYTETEVKTYERLLQMLKEKGSYYIPVVDQEGNLQWEKSLEQMPDVPAVNVRGPQGEKGEKGEKGDLNEASVLYTQQPLTSEQQAQARANIGVENMLIVNVDDSPASHTATEIYEHIQNGGTAMAFYNHIYYPLTWLDLGSAEFNAYEGEQGYFDGVIVYADGSVEYYEKDLVTHSYMKHHEAESKKTFANALKGSVTGKAVGINDASPFAQEVAVKLESENITDFSNVKVKKYPSKNYAPYERVEIDRVDNTTFVFAEPLEVGKTYRFTADVESSFDGVCVVTFAPSGMQQTVSKGIGKTFPFTVPEKGCTGIHLYSANNWGATLGHTAIYDRISVIEDCQPTEHIPTADGIVNGIIGNGEPMTLLTDSPDATITAEYNRDANKVIAQIEAILSTLLGG